MHTELDDGDLLVGFDRRGRLVAKLLERTDAGRFVVDAIKTAPLDLTGVTALIVLVTWANRRFRTIDLNSATVFDPQRGITNTRPIIVEELRHGGEELRDFSVENAAAVAARVRKLAAFRPTSGRRLLSQQELVAALRDEIAQMKDLLAAVEAGKVHHLSGLATRMRLLVYNGRSPKLGLLQHLAATRDAKLTLYTCPDPGGDLAIEIQWLFLMDAEADPVGRRSNPVDLDIWLGLRGAILWGKSYTNLEMIKYIADTQGAHRDPSLPDLVDVMRRGTGQFQQLRAFTVQTARVIIAVADRLMAVVGERI